MAKTIPQLTAASASQLTDLIEVSQGGASFKETLQQVLNLFIADKVFELVGFQNIDLTSGSVTLTNPMKRSYTISNSSPGNTITLAAINASSFGVGTIMRFVSLTGDSVTIRDATNTPIITINPLATCDLLITDNSSSAGAFQATMYGQAASLDVPIPISAGGTNASTAANARTNLGLGTAAVKNATNSGSSIVSSVVGTITGGELAQFNNDASGTIESAPLSAGQIVTFSSNLSGMADPYSCCSYIHAAQNNGATQPNLTGSDLVLNNPAPTYFNISNNNGTTAIQLPPPPDVDGTFAWQVGQLIRFNNATGSNGVPIKDYNGSSIQTLATGGIYDLVYKTSAGAVDIMRLA